MTDREMLELAAKAAGAEVIGFRGAEPLYGIPAEHEDGSTTYRKWRPLDDDGDALRLAVKLHLDIAFIWDGESDQHDEVQVRTHGARKDAAEQIGLCRSYGEFDEMSATRRAIVRAAAEIGREMT